VRWRRTLDDDVEQLVELTAGVVLVGLSRLAADGGKEEVDPDGRVLILEPVLELVDLAAQPLGAVRSGSKRAPAACQLTQRTSC
jgi:hypothetical protein